MSASMLDQTGSLVDFPGFARPQPTPSMAERLEGWLATRVRARLAPRQRALVAVAAATPAIAWGVDGLLRSEPTTLSIYADRGTAAGRLARLRAAPDGSAGAVISVGALAEAADAAALLAEIQRVLRPGGRLVFVEPVAARAGTRLRRLQKALRNSWRAVAGFRNSPRDLWNDLKAARFAELRFEWRTLPGLLGLPVPHLVGHAVRVAASPIADAPPRRARPPSPRLPVLATLSWGGPTFAFFG